MSAALTHAAMGLLLGLALRLSWKQLPLAALLAELPDLDHLGLFTSIPGLVSRGTLHNVFFCVLAPVAVAVWMRWKDIAPAWQRLAFGAPLLLTSHLLLDMLPLDPLGGVGTVLLLYPLFATKFTIDFKAIAPYIDPTTYSTITILLVVLSLLTLATLWASERKARLPWRPVVAFVGAWLLLFPAAAVAGSLVVAPSYPDALLAAESPRLRLPEGRAIAIVHHLGGTTMGASAMRAEIRDGAKIVGTASLPNKLQPGETWILDVPLEGNARTMGPLTITLVHARTGHVYTTARMGIEKGHLDLPLTLAPDATPTRLSARNGGDAPAPAGSLRAIATQGASIVQNVTNEAPLTPGGSWSLPAVGTLTGGVVTWELRAADDGALYDRRQTTPG